MFPGQSMCALGCQGSRVMLLRSGFYYVFAGTPVNFYFNTKHRSVQPLIVLQCILSSLNIKTIT